ncbi:phosphoribosylamine--glycine ligase [PVC group bacterium (ex Bugula neritina AB1)]|nr:phosphoribosylamine--glycine ligase [PVC group bacterium (ex Bugula neritina AB1)]
MKILVIGSGGREHALVWAIKKSPKVDDVYCMPGNPGTSEIAINVDMSIKDVDAIADWCVSNAIDLTVVGPEAPLVEGIVDTFEKRGIPVFGPSKDAARLEGSKVFAKNFLQKYSIPTASHASFSDAKDAMDFIKTQKIPIVIKVDGLAAGKGVFICLNIDEVKQALDKIFVEKFFGEAGTKIVVEEYMEGEEISIFALCDGKDALIMNPSRDHKRIFDNDKGPNTGGMGAYSPVPDISPDLMKNIEENIVQPTLRGMEEEGYPYKGVLFVGIMLTSEGSKVLEYNIRFGDPEAQVILPLLKTDVLEVFEKCIEGKVLDLDLNWKNEYAVCLVLTSKGYPDNPSLGSIIRIDEKIKKDPEVLIFHAGTSFDGPEYITSGGRVLNIVVYGKTLANASEKLYSKVSLVSFDGMHYRKDIGVKS